MKRFAAMFLCIMLLYCAACTPGTGTPIETTAPSGEPAVAEPPVYEPDVPETGGETLRVVFPMITFTDQTRYMDYITEILHKDNIDIVFEVFKAGSQEYYAQYTQHIIDHIDDDNTVYLINGNMMFDDSIAKDFYSLAEAVAPTYIARVKKLSDYEPGILRSINVGHIYRPTERLAALVKTDVWDAYGSEINTASDFKALLEHLKAANPENIPGSISPLLFNNYTSMGENMTFSLFAGEAGYYPANSLNYGRNRFCYADSSGVIYPFYKVDAIREGLAELYGWKEQGLVRFWNPGQYEVNLGQYDALLLNTMSFQGNSIEMYDPTFNDVDWAQYHMSILYSDAYPSLPQGDLEYSLMGGVAGKNADPTPFLAFCEWMQDPDNYRTLHNGVEGVDWEWSGDRIKALETAIDYPSWDHLVFMVIDDLAEPNYNMPNNYHEAVASIYHPFTLTVDDDIIDPLYRSNRDSIVEANNAVYNTIANQFALLYGNSSVSTPEKIVDSLIQKLRDDDPQRDIVDIINEYVKVER